MSSITRVWNLFNTSNQNGQNCLPKQCSHVMSPFMTVVQRKKFWSQLQLLIEDYLQLHCYINPLFPKFHYIILLFICVYFDVRIFRGGVCIEITLKESVMAKGLGAPGLNQYETSSFKLQSIQQNSSHIFFHITCCPHQCFLCFSSCDRH